MRTPEDHETDPDDLVRFGTIATVDLASARCTVALDDGSETPPIRWVAPRMGETRVWSPPAEGEQVLVLCPAGEIGGAVALGGVISTARPAPGASRTELIHFADGAILSYDPEAHALTFALPAGATMAIEAGGGVTIGGDVSITGDVAVTGTVTASEDVIGGGKSLKNHKHGGVQAGGAQTGTPV